MKVDIETLTKKGWHNDDKLIGCYPWIPGRVGIKAFCELCHRPVTAFPVSIARTKEDPTWHIICLPCKTDLGTIHEIKPGGAIRDNKIIEYD